MSELIQLIYKSRSTCAMERKELQDLLEAARTRNSELNITGILLFKDGEFLQVLEGESSKVKALFERIHRDPRHTEVQLVWEETCAKRSFSKWSMGFADLSSVRPPGYSDVLQNTRALYQLTDDPSLNRVLRDFKSGQLRLHAV